MKNKLEVLITAILALTACTAGLTGCGSDSDTTPPQVTTPQRIIMTQPVYHAVEKMVIWEEAPNASGYVLTLTGSGVNRSATITEKNPFNDAYGYEITENVSGSYEVSVTAKGDGINYVDSLKKTIAIYHYAESSHIYSDVLEIENMTDERLIEEAYGGTKVSVPDFYLPDDFGVEFEYGEYWPHVWLNSVSTADEAEEEAELFVLAQTPASYTIDYIGENEYYYQFKVKYSYQNPRPVTFIARIIVYKLSARYLTFDSQNGYYSEIRALDRNSVFELLDLETFLYHNPWRSARVIYRDLNETSGEYVYTYYRTSITRGDLGSPDVAHLEKVEIKINKITGEGILNPESQTLKTVVIPNTAG